MSLRYTPSTQITITYSFKPFKSAIALAELSIYKVLDNNF